VSARAHARTHTRTQSFVVVVVVIIIIIIIIIITINIRHELGLDRPVSASSNNLFQGLPSRLRPFGLQFSIIFGIQVLFFLFYLS
jgi:amino acid transporter